MDKVIEKLIKVLRKEVWLEKNYEAHPRVDYSRRNFTPHLVDHKNRYGNKYLIYFEYKPESHWRKVITTREWIEWADEKGLPRNYDKGYEKVKIRFAKETVKETRNEQLSTFVKDPLNALLSVFLLGAYRRKILMDYLQRKAKVSDLETGKGWTYIQNFINDFQYMLSRSPELYTQGVIPISEKVEGSVRTVKKEEDE